MKRSSITIITLLIISSIIIYLNRHEKQNPKANQPSLPLPESPANPTPEQPTPSLIGEQILRDYATAKTTLKQDLSLLRRLNISFINLVKNHDRLPIGCNADLADALRGQNPHQHRFLPDNHKAFNKAGLLVDRHGSPLHLHVEQAGYYQLRSPGPDQTLWTKDDQQINANGSFSKAK